MLGFLLHLIDECSGVIHPNTILNLCVGVKT